MSTAAEVSFQLARYKAASDDRTVRRMLGQWVSELEPSIAVQNGEIIGLTLAGDPTGHIVVTAGIDMRPMLDLVMAQLGMHHERVEFVRPGYYIGNDF